jgi:hypothetical protein
VGVLASPTTSAWQDLARHVKEHPGSTDAVDALGQMSEQAAGDLLYDALDHWSVAGADFSIVAVDVPEPVPGDEPPAPAYAVCPGTVHAGGGPLPILVLVPETPVAGADDIDTERSEVGVGHDRN